MKGKWADGLVKKPKFKDIRVRIATRRDHGREPTFQEIAAVVADRSDPFKGHISEQEIIGAYERGEEVCRVSWIPQLVMNSDVDSPWTETTCVENGVHRI